MVTSALVHSTGIVCHYDLNGYRVAVRAPDVEARTVIRQIFRSFDSIEGMDLDQPASYRFARDAGGDWVVSAGDQVWYRSAHIADALIALEWRVVTAMLEYRRDLFHLHAAALATPSQSSGIVIVGESGSGKTTLTLGLMARGFLPFADDVALMDPTTLMLQPFHRAFHMDEQTRDLVQRLGVPDNWDFDAAPPGYFLVPAWATESVPPGVVLFPQLSPGAPPQLEPMTIPDAAQTLLPYSTTLSHSPARALATVARLTERARCYRLVAGDLDATVRLVAGLVADGAP